MPRCVVLVPCQAPARVGWPPRHTAEPRRCRHQHEVHLRCPLIPWVQRAALGVHGLARAIREGDPCGTQLGRHELGSHRRQVPREDLSRCFPDSTNAGHHAPAVSCVKTGDLSSFLFILIKAFFCHNKLPYIRTYNIQWNILRLELIVRKIIIVSNCPGY